MRYLKFIIRTKYYYIKNISFVQMFISYNINWENIQSNSVIKELFLPLFFILTFFLIAILSTFSLSLSGSSLLLSALAPILATSLTELLAVDFIFFLILSLIFSPRRASSARFRAPLTTFFFYGALYCFCCFAFCNF